VIATIPAGWYGRQPFFFPRLDIGAIPLLGVATFTDPATTITIRCSDSNSAQDQGVLTATKIGQLH